MEFLASTRRRSYYLWWLCSRLSVLICFFVLLVLPNDHFSQCYHSSTCVRLQLSALTRGFQHLPFLWSRPWAFRYPWTHAWVSLSCSAFLVCDKGFLLNRLVLASLRCSLKPLHSTWHAVWFSLAFASKGASVKTFYYQYCASFRLISFIRSGPLS